MCKAGFAGDDAPRAVFRKFSRLIGFPNDPSMIIANFAPQLPLSGVLAIMGNTTPSNLSSTLDLLH
jgi:hypothetical protein